MKVPDNVSIIERLLTGKTSVISVTHQCVHVPKSRIVGYPSLSCVYNLAPCASEVTIRTAANREPLEDELELSVRLLADDAENVTDLQTQLTTKMVRIGSASETLETRKALLRARMLGYVWIAFELELYQVAIGLKGKSCWRIG